MAIYEITEDNFEQEVLLSKEPVLVDFWAQWCGPCIMLSPLMEQVSNEVVGSKIAKINIDEQQKLAAKYNVASIPTLLLFENGKVVKQSIGLVSKSAILQLLK